MSCHVIQFHAIRFHLWIQLNFIFVLILTPSHFGLILFHWMQCHYMLFDCISLHVIFISQFDIHFNFMPGHVISLIPSLLTSCHVMWFHLIHVSFRFILLNLCSFDFVSLIRSSLITLHYIPLHVMWFYVIWFHIYFSTDHYI